ncbi:MAG: C_GCAxxG_C_C family protein [Bacteroidales bacterium]|nr:C_GCAxxG_C_C family protein [Bacteroidales bacterium]
METRKQIAVAKKQSGYNCAQAVLCAYVDIAGIDEESAIRLAAPFGAGMGNMEGTCGAITGAGLVLGLSGGSTKQMRQIMNKFQERNGATQCKLLKGVGTGKVLRECNDCVADAAEFLEEQIGKIRSLL